MHGRPETDGRLTVHTLITISHINMAVPAAAVYVTKGGPLDVLGEKLVFESYEAMKVSAHECLARERTSRRRVAAVIHRLNSARWRLRMNSQASD